MLLGLVIVSTLASALALVLDARAGWRPKRWLEKLEAQPVLVELRGSRTVAGILTAVHHDTLVIAQARIIGGNLNVDAGGGELLIPRERIEWIQRGIVIDDLEDVVQREAA